MPAFTVCQYSLDRVFRFTTMVKSSAIAGTASMATSIRARTTDRIFFMNTYLLKLICISAMRPFGSISFASINLIITHAHNLVNSLYNIICLFSNSLVILGTKNKVFQVRFVNLWVTWRCDAWP